MERAKKKCILEAKLSGLEVGMFVSFWEELSVTYRFGAWSTEWRVVPLIEMGEQWGREDGSWESGGRRRKPRCFEQDMLKYEMPVKYMSGGRLGKQ